MDEDNHAYMGEQEQRQLIQHFLQQLVDQVPILKRSKTDILLDPHRELIMKSWIVGRSYRDIANALAKANIQTSVESIRRYIIKNTERLKKDSKPKE